MFITIFVEKVKNLGRAGGSFSPDFARGGLPRIGNLIVGGVRGCGREKTLSKLFLRRKNTFSSRGQKPNAFEVKNLFRPKDKNLGAPRERALDMMGGVCGGNIHLKPNSVADQCRECPRVPCGSCTGGTGPKAGVVGTLWPVVMGHANWPFPPLQLPHLDPPD